MFYFKPAFLDVLTISVGLKSIFNVAQYNVLFYLFVYLPNPSARQDMTQGQFLNGVYRFQFSFPSPRLVA